MSLALMLALVGCQSAPGPEPASPPIELPATPPPPDPPAASPPDAAGSTLFVDHEVVPCEGEGPMTCLRVRASESEDWELFYDSIVGFQHEEGHAYELRVERRTVPNPPADASSFRYHLLEIVSKRRVP